MLTRPQRVYHWIRPGRSISSDRLDPGCLPHLSRAIGVYRRMIGRERGRVRDAVRAALAALRPEQVEAVVELLEDQAVYEWPRGTRQAEARLRIFEAAAREHPVLERERTADLLRDRNPVASLYGDYPEFHRLGAFPERYAAADLWTDYDLAQAQALLYDAVQVTVEAGRDFKHIVRYARLARLLHRIERMRSGGYRLVFDGPNSVLRHTHAYGVDFARFLAALVQARDWTMTAEVTLRRRWRAVTFTLSDRDGLRSRVPAPALFDSQLEEKFAKKFGAERRGWRLGRETAILEAGESLVVPDFVFMHADGTEVAMEIVGYWTPEYLDEKFAKLSQVRSVNLLVAVRRSLALRAGSPVEESLPHTVLLFRSAILLRDLMPKLEGFRPHSG